MATAVKQMADMDIAPDMAQKTVSLSGAAAQAALAEWLLNQLDQPVSPGQEPAAYDYQAGAPDTAVRVFRVPHIRTLTGGQELENAIRTIAGTSRELLWGVRLVVRGTTDQVALAEWLVKQLDEPSSASQEAAYDFQAGAPDTAVRVIRLAPIGTEQDFLETFYTIRWVEGVDRISSFSAQRALIVRGTTDQVALTEWLVNQLDHPAPRSHQPAVYDQAGTPEPAVRVFGLAEIDTKEGFEEITGAMRTIGESYRTYICKAQRALVMRGTADQAALAEWLLNQLDQPVPPGHGPAVYDYRAGNRESAVRVFRLAQNDTPQDFQEVADAIRTVGSVSRLLVYNAQAVVMRGTADQAALAEWLVNELDRPAPPSHQVAAYDYQAGVVGVWAYTAVRVFHLAHIETLRDLQETNAAIRTMADAQACLVASKRAVAMRVTAEAAAVAEWLANELDQPAGVPRDAAMPVPGSGEVVHIFPLANPLTGPQFEAINTPARRTLNISRIFFLQNAVLVRGTPDQIAGAGQLIREAVKP
ncbi:MAG: hypothetical protein WBL61_12760 [Bryobacteraceae bacterium]